MNKNIGELIKQRRTENKMTLKDISETKEKAVLRSYEREILRIEGSSIIEYAMTNMADRGEMLPKLVEILPQKEVEESLPYPHEG